MENKLSTVSEAFSLYSKVIYHYVKNRINDEAESEDISQDVFVRLMDCDIIYPGSVKSLLFTIANNLVVDYLRRYYKRQDIYSYVYDVNRKSHVLTPEQICVTKDLEAQEIIIMDRLAPATRRVYKMTREDAMTIDDISATLNISRRTVECHQFKGRKYVREVFKKIV